MKKSPHVLLILFLLLIFPNLYLSAQGLNWENPEVLQKTNTRFVRAASGGDIIVLAWQEFELKEGKRYTYLSLWTTRNTKEWKKNERFAGPYFFTDKETQIYSLAVDNDGNIYVAASVSEYKTTIFFSKDEGETFLSTTITSEQAVLSPKLYTKDNGDFYVFAGYEDTLSEALSIYYLLLNKRNFNYSSYLGQFKRFVTETEEELGFNFLPSYCYFKGKEYVVFQARIKCCVFTSRILAASQWFLLLK